MPLCSFLAEYEDLLGYLQALEPAEMSHQLLINLGIWTVRRNLEWLHCDKKTNIGYKEKHTR